MGHQIESEAGVSVTRSKERLGCVRKTRVSCLQLFGRLHNSRHSDAIPSRLPC